MSTHRALRVATLGALLWLGSTPRPADASCVVDNQGPCYRYWHTGMVLLAEVRERDVIEKRLIEERYFLGYTYRLRLAVLERFRGVARGETEVIVHAYDGECGFAPAVGSRVFVYADRGADGAFWLSMYSRPFEDADEDLEYARLAVRGLASAMVYGQVEHREDPVLDASAFTSLAGVRVRARGAGFDTVATTDDDGNYAIRLPGTGKYEIEVVPPRGMADRDAGPTTFTIEQSQECLRVDYQLFTNGRIRGVVIDEVTGRPIPNLVVGTGDYFVSSTTSRTGAFDIGPLSKGAYLLEAKTGTGSVTLLPGTVTVMSGRPTELRPLVARLARPLATVVFDLSGLAGEGWAEIGQLQIALRIGRERQATFALELGETFEIALSIDETRKTATFVVDAEVTRVTLSRLAWHPSP